ncbi:hypothetical protein ACIOJE_28655 [Kitasatospora sp. NPDC087861]|uniref:hypothetical protein n=1 Tax=Kitasatospora sp. NPDC087861 TaxID=3364070 RepID=UPI0038287B32
MRSREEEHAQDNERLRRLFNDPVRAAGVLQEAAVRHDAPGHVSRILLDNATVDQALRYFSEASRGERIALPRIDQTMPLTLQEILRQGHRRVRRPRFALLAVAEFVNAAVLYEEILTGPEGGRVLYADPMVAEVQRIARTVTEKTSWDEVFAVLALAKATAVEAADSQGMIEKIGALLEVPLEGDNVLRHLREIELEVAGGTGHKYGIIDERVYYPSTVDNLTNSQAAVTRIDPNDRFLDSDWLPHGTDRVPCGPEFFASHLIYRTRVYLLLADLIGCPYGADALRSELVQTPQNRGFAERVATLVGDAENARDRQTNEMLGYEAFKIRIPLVLKNVLSRATRPSEVLEITLETRDSRSARRFRKYCARVDSAIAEGKRDDVARACTELSAYGVRFEAELSEQSSMRGSAMQAAKELISVGSPLLGALLPGLGLAAGKTNRWFRGRKFAFVEQLASTPRNLSEIEQEFAHL